MMIEEKISHILHVSHFISTFLEESIVEIMDDVAYITLPSAESDTEGNTESDTESEVDPIKSTIACALPDGRFLDKKITILSNVKATKLLPEAFSIDSHENKLVYCAKNIINTMVFSKEMFFVDMGIFFQNGGFKIVLIKSLQNRMQPPC